MRHFVIGDVQGCLTPLKRLLDKLQFSDSDRLWFTGDLVNRGPESLETLRFIHALGPQHVTVLGNHDLHCLAIWHNERQPRSSDTLDALFKAEDCDALLHWLQSQPLLHHDTQLHCTLTHAGIFPGWSFETAQNLANESEALLRGPKVKEFFHHMFGNTPNQWDDNLEGWDRQRFIINAFTRMRYCHEDLSLDLDFKGPMHEKPSHLTPWFEKLSNEWDDQTLLFGHWASLEGETFHKNILAVDTGCVWGNKLSAVRLESGVWIQEPGFNGASIS